MEEAQELYDLVLRTANEFLHNCKHFDIEILAADNPTYAEIAQVMEKLAAIIGVLADEFDPMLGQKAIDYCSHMKKMGLAIKNGNEVELSNLVTELERRPFL